MKEISGDIQVAEEAELEERLKKPRRSAGGGSEGEVMGGEGKRGRGKGGGELDGGEVGENEEERVR